VIFGLLPRRLINAAQRLLQRGPIARPEIAAYTC
jgi:hypothetical protein